MRHRSSHTVIVRGVAIGMLALLALLAVQAEAISSDDIDDPITFSKDVAPIFQQKCQVCHQPNAIAPMSLLTYKETRPWVRSIKAKVMAREMPPWHLDKTIGIQKFKNDRSLSDGQIDTIVRWIDTGAPEGNPEDLPPPVEWPDPTRWQLADQFGEPDLIVPSKAYTVEAEAQDKWWRPTVETGLTEARWVRAIEMRPSFPGGRKAVHHVLAYLVQDEEGIVGLASSVPPGAQRNAGLFFEWAIGKVGEVFPENAGKLMLPDSKIQWEVHYHAFGEEIPDDVVELGVYFYPKGYVPKYRTILRMIGEGGEEGRIDIPPGEVSRIQHYGVLPAPARVENFQPHMHMRGKAMSMEAIYPDGRTELLSMVDNFQWNWHINYVYDEEVAPVLPKGTILAITSWHDNTTDNPNNPDPKQWVGYGDRTVDEMAHAWLDITYLNDDDYEEEVAKRKAQQESN